MSRAFPIRPKPADDSRFTFGLTIDVAKVLAAHGYPDLTDPAAGSGHDIVELQQALYRFLYVGEEEQR